MESRAEAEPSLMDADEAVVYPASVDQSWVDSTKRAEAEPSMMDADEAVVYPASIDQSWVDSNTA